MADNTLSSNRPTPRVEPSPTRVEPVETRVKLRSKNGVETRLTLMWPWLAALVILALGLGVRYYDLTDEPLDFHPTRQLRGAIIARGLYWEMLPEADPATRELAMTLPSATGQYEPPFLEHLVARTYLLMGRENIWVARAYNSLFWVIGGLALFALARRMTANADGSTSPGAALIVLGYYLVLPFAVQASRSFQPDPMMVMWVLLAVWALFRWSEAQTWKWALLAGLLGGVAILSKAVAAYLMAGAAAGLVLSTLVETQNLTSLLASLRARLIFRRLLRNLQVWAIALLMLAPTFIYYLAGRGGRAAEYFNSWTVELSHLLLEPSFYMRWFNLVQSLMELTPLLLALLGILIATPKNRALLLGLWGGYAAYGLFLPYQMTTHNYYHLQLVPIVALSLLPPAQLLIGRLRQQGRFWQVLAAGVALAALLFPASLSVLAQRSEDYRHEPPYWQEIASHLPTDGKIMGLTQDYGYRLMYYGWRKIILWPNRGERKLASLRGNEGELREFEEYFLKRSEGKSYFLVTAFGQFEDQPDLKQYLHAHYPIYAEGSGYLIFDLLHPK